MSKPNEILRLGYAWATWRQRTGQISALTAKEQRYCIAYFAEAMGNRKARQLGESDIIRWRESMTSHLSPGTVRLRWTTAYAFLEWMIDEGKIQRNPARRLPAPKVPRSVHRNLRPDQADALHDACIDSRERLIVALSFQLGLRRAEIARAQVGDFDFVDRTVRITGKGGHERVVALTVAVEKVIASYLSEMPFRAGALVRDASGLRGISAEYVGKIFSNIAYRAGVKTRAWDGVGSHSGRHTAATDVAHRSGDAVIVRDFLGHASLATTDRYIGTADIEAQRVALEGRRYGTSSEAVATPKAEGVLTDEETAAQLERVGEG